MHGKGSRTGKTNENQFDVSNASMDYYFTDTDDKYNMVSPMKSSLCTSIDAMYEADVRFAIKPICAPDPEFKGLWGDKSIHSMSSQSAIMGIPSFQIESPPNLR